jgi:hypothetical protein
MVANAHENAPRAAREPALFGLSLWRELEKRIFRTLFSPHADHLPALAITFGAN